MRKDPVILHCDINNFYASVECLFAPELSTVPMAVAGDPEKRHGIILAKNNLAKAAGVQTAEPIFQARKKCPGLVLVPPRHDEYLKYSRLVRSIYLSVTDRVESFGLDEAWLDVTHSQSLFGDGAAIADRLREEVKTKTKGLTISVGVSFTKAFAKLGSDMKKPDATTLLPRSALRKVIWPLPVEDLLFVGRQTAEKLHKLNLYTIGDVARSEESLLREHFGAGGEKLFRTALGLPDEPVLRYDENRPVKSIGHGVTTEQDVESLPAFEEVARALAERTAARLRKHHLAAMTVQLTLRDNALHTINRQKTLPAPVQTAAQIFSAAMELLEKHYDFERAKPLRTITLSVTGLLTEQSGQMDFLTTPREEKQLKLERSLDRIRQKYGFGSVLPARISGRIVCREEADDEADLPFHRQ